MGLLDLFVKVEDDGQGKKPGKGEPAQQPPTVAPVSAPVQTQTSFASPSGQEDAEIRQQLADALEKANVEGYDYFEFARAVDAQINILPAEALRYQASFAMATSMGVSVDKLLSSADFYLSILKKKEDEFNKALDSHSANSVTSKEEAIKKIDLDMQSLGEQIKKITEQINALQQQKTASMNEISSAKAEIEKIKNNFYATLKIFTGRISADIEKIKSYLTGGK